MPPTDSTSPADPAPGGSLPGRQLDLIDAYWRAANYLSVGQIYLLDNPLLREAAAGRARQAAGCWATGGRHRG